MKNKITSIKLKKDEQLTLHHGKSEYDIAKKEWGYYVTPSIQKRLKNFNLEAILIKKSNDFFLCLVKKNKKKDFDNFLHNKKIKFIENLSRTSNFKKIF